MSSHFETLSQRITFIDYFLTMNCLRYVWSGCFWCDMMALEHGMDQWLQVMFWLSLSMRCGCSRILLIALMMIFWQWIRSQIGQKKGVSTKACSWAVCQRLTTETVLLDWTSAFWGLVWEPVWYPVFVSGRCIFQPNLDNACQIFQGLSRYSATS